MNESTLNIDEGRWSRQKEVVRIFYKEMWDHANTALVPQIFHPDFTFRGSLGKLRFHGYHRRELFEVQPSGRHVWWYGTPIFTFDGELVRDLWVLGDVHGLIGRLKGSSNGQVG